MVIKNTGKRKYYVYQDGKQIGKLNKKNKTYVVNNIHTTSIYQSSRVKEIIFYVVCAILLVICAIWGRPMILVLAVVCGKAYNPFDLTSKSNILFPKARGEIKLRDDYKHESEEEFIFQKRPIFLWVRYFSLLVFFFMGFEQFIENYFIYKKNLWLIFLGVFAVIAIVFIIFITRAFIRNLKAAKLELKEQEKMLLKHN